MNRDALIILALIAGAILGKLGGWFIAHAEIATECKRQGGFYVGKEDFVCYLKERK